MSFRVGELERGAIRVSTKRSLRAIDSQRNRILRDSTTKRLVRGHIEPVERRSVAGSAEEARRRKTANLRTVNPLRGTNSLVSAACQRNVSETDLAELDSDSRRRAQVRTAKSFAHDATVSRLCHFGEFLCPRCQRSHHVHL